MIFGQITQQVFVVEEWCHDARKVADAKAISHAEVEKTLGALKHVQHELVEKFK